MSIVVVGTVAYDSIETPFGKVEEILGGSALYFTVSASFFAPVKLVAIVGKDFEFSKIAFLKDRQVDLEGLNISEGKTFRWKGYYDYNLNEAHTIETQLNVLESFNPELPEDYKKEKYLFLANIDPDLQLKVLNQMESPHFIAADTMNFWIASKKEKVFEVFSRVDAVTINEGEIRELTEEYNTVKAARKILNLGPQYVIIKRGEYGVLVFEKSGDIFFAPAYPLEVVFDPTGAGDTFAGGMMGYLASKKDSGLEIRRAVVYGSVLASFNVEKFSFNKLLEISTQEVEDRFREFLSFCRVEK